MASEVVRPEVEDLNASMWEMRRKNYTGNENLLMLHADGRQK